MIVHVHTVSIFLLGTSDDDSIYICTKTALVNQKYRSYYMTRDQKAIVYFSVHVTLTV